MKRLIGKSTVSVLGLYLQGIGQYVDVAHLSQLGLPVILIAGMYFLLIAPNQKKQKAWQGMLAALKAGDKVTTNGGLRGTVLQVKDEVVIIKVQPDGLKLEFVKSAIAAVTTDDKS